MGAVVESTHRSSSGSHPGKDSHRSHPWEEGHDGEYQVAQIAEPSRPFRLERGDILPEVQLAYETWGELAPDRDNAVLVCHALTGDSHAASHPDRSTSAAGWWESMIGPGRPLDTRRSFVICVNVLGGCGGSTGPASPHPEDGRPWGRRFPLVTIRDMVRAQHELLTKHLGIRRLRLVIGGSMGGMQALEWAAMYPEAVGALVSIAAPLQHSAQAIAFNTVQREIILQLGGADSESGRQRQALAIARMLGMITYQSWDSMEQKFGRQRVPATPAVDGGNASLPDCRRAEADWADTAQLNPLWAARERTPFEVERYLRHQGDKLVRRFNVDSYLYLTLAIDYHDLGEGRGGLEAALERLNMPVLAVGIRSDILYPTHEQRLLVQLLTNLGRPAYYEELDSPWGHDAFLIETHALGQIVREFWATLAAPGGVLFDVSGGGAPARPRPLFTGSSRTRLQPAFRYLPPDPDPDPGSDLGRADQEPLPQPNPRSSPASSLGALSQATVPDEAAAPPETDRWLEPAPPARNGAHPEGRAPADPGQPAR